MNHPLQEYFSALDRLKKNQPINLPKRTKITNDAVSLEAGRSKGSIKKSRSMFASLILDIEQAAAEQFKRSNQESEKLERAKQSATQYRLELEAALERELSLLYELYEIKKQLAQITGANVLPIRPEGKCQHST
ncbi:hypothetical protein [Undibacterium sp.]|uniref:hypothetical protein n=1 Tax=Undibacterium sp. TaxID=1914977 RepID=UPI002CD8F5A2|nr:hypothetical protein [Undibacterium sp.]HTD02745.1 hypothetical protein [Undibacterium sp.]